jgi:hypothetical protein
MRRICGPIRNQDWIWRLRTNEKIDFLIKRANKMKYTKAQRIRWIGHVLRMDKENTVERKTVWRPIVVRIIGRPRLRWKDDVRADLGKMQI